MSQEEDPLVDHQRYEKIRNLNEGAYGFVVLAKDKLSNEKVAIKFLPRGPRVNKRVEREVLNHKNLLHHHVIQFKGVFLTRRYLAIVMEYAPGGDLLEFIRERKGIQEDMARWFFQQLIIGLDYIHRMGVVNRDIKLENTLLDDNPWPIVKICDFGYSKHEENDSAPYSIVGTQPYLAPEVINRQDPSKEVYDGKKADIWCCGVLLYVMLARHYPFERLGEDRIKNAAVIRQRVLKLDYTIPPNSMSQDCADLIKKILVLDPESRPGIAEIQKHRWYQTNLPEGALSMNESLETQDIQKEQDVIALFADARKEPA
eukprot:g3093.t1